MGENVTPSDGEPGGDVVETLDYTSLSSDVHPIRNQWTQMHTEALTSLGFDINFEALSVPDYVDRGFTQREFDLYPLRWGDGWDPDRVLSDFFGEAALAEGGGNVSGYQDDDYEEMLQEQRTAVDRDERQQIVYEMQQKVIEEEHIITPVFVQVRGMPWNSNRYTDTVSQPENGLASYWNMTSVESTDQGNERLLYGQTEDLTHINPLSGSVTRAERDMVKIVYDRLLRVPADGGAPEPAAAESVEWADDTTIEVTLREGLTFHDGEDLTAEDVQFSYEYTAENSPSTIMDPVDEIVVENDLELTFNLGNPSAAYEVNGLAGRDGSILPQHVWEDVPDSVDADSASGWSNTEPVGSGPFQVENFTLGEQTELSAFEDHYDAPNVDEAVRVQYGGTRAMVRQIEDGSIDMIAYGVNPSDIERLQNNQQLDVVEPLMTSIHYATYNLRNELFQEENVRRAMGYAIPKQDALDAAVAGRGEIIHTCFSPAIEFWANPDISEMFQDLDQAEQLLRDTGFEWDSDGRIHYPADW